MGCGSAKLPTDDAFDRDGGSHFVQVASVRDRECRRPSDPGSVCSGRGDVYGFMLTDHPHLPPLPPPVLHHPHLPLSSVIQDSIGRFDPSTVTTFSGNSKIRVSLSSDGSLLEVETESFPDAERTTGGAGNGMAISNGAVNGSADESLNDDGEVDQYTDIKFDGDVRHGDAAGIGSDFTSRCLERKFASVSNRRPDVPGKMAASSKGRKEKVARSASATTQFQHAMRRSSSTACRFSPKSSLLPLTLNLLPSTSNPLPSTSNVLPPTSNLLPSTANLLLPTSNPLPSTSNLLPSTSNLLPSTSKPLPSSSNILPPTSNLLPPTRSLLPPTLNRSKSLFNVHTRGDAQDNSETDVDKTKNGAAEERSECLDKNSISLIKKYFPNKTKSSDAKQKRLKDNKPIQRRTSSICVEASSDKNNQRLDCKPEMTSRASRDDCKPEMMSRASRNDCKPEMTSRSSRDDEHQNCRSRYNRHLNDNKISTGGSRGADLSWWRNNAPTMNDQAGAGMSGEVAGMSGEEVGSGRGAMQKSTATVAGENGTIRLKISGKNSKEKRRSSTLHDNCAEILNSNVSHIDAIKQTAAIPVDVAAVAAAAPAAPAAPAAAVPRQDDCPIHNGASNSFGCDLFDELSQVCGPSENMATVSNAVRRMHRLDEIKAYFSGNKRKISPATVAAVAVATRELFYPGMTNSVSPPQSGNSRPTGPENSVPGSAGSVAGAVVRSAATTSTSTADGVGSGGRSSYDDASINLRTGRKSVARNGDVGSNSCYHRGSSGSNLGIVDRMENIDTPPPADINAICRTLPVSKFDVHDSRSIKPTSADRSNLCDANESAVNGTEDAAPADDVDAADAAASAANGINVAAERKLSGFIIFQKMIGLSNYTARGKIRKIKSQTLPCSATLKSVDDRSDGIPRSLTTGRLKISTSGGFFKLPKSKNKKQQELKLSFSNNNSNNHATSVSQKITRIKPNSVAVLNAFAGEQTRLIDNTFACEQATDPAIPRSSKNRTFFAPRHKTDITSQKSPTSIDLTLPTSSIFSNGIRNVIDTPSGDSLPGVQSLDRRDDDDVMQSVAPDYLCVHTDFYNGQFKVETHQFSLF